MPASKFSRQREAILEELRSRYDHPTAETLYLSLKQKIPNLSLGTVYRNLNLLSDEGIINKISSDGADRFDADKTTHYHLRCTECGGLFDIDFPIIEVINEKAESFADCKITSHELTFIGVCKNCLH